MARTLHTEQRKHSDWESDAYYSLLVGVIRQAHHDVEWGQTGRAPRSGRACHATPTAKDIDEAQSFLAWLRSEWT